MQSEMAVLSITSRRRFKVSIWETRSNFFAAGLRLGSES